MMEPATARDYLREVARSTDDFTTKWVIDGIFWADESCRICGTLSLALGNANAEGGKKLLQHLLDSGVTTQAEVPRFLNQYFHTCLNILSLHTCLNILSPTATVVWKEDPRA